MEASELINDLIALGWTQAKIAERVGLQQPAISKVLRGEVSDVMSRSYRRLAALHAEVIPKKSRKA